MASFLSLGLRATAISAVGYCAYRGLNYFQNQLPSTKQEEIVKQTMPNNASTPSREIETERTRKNANNFFQSRSSSNVNLRPEAIEAFREACRAARQDDADQDQLEKSKSFCES